MRALCARDVGKLAEWDPLWAIKPKKRIRRFAKYKNLNVKKRWL
jgi:hypothetical protein